VSFPNEDLQVNIEAVLSHLNKVKPTSAKGTYMKAVNLSAQQTPSVKLAVS
jgi:large subunit ribosomal protein L1